MMRITLAALALVAACGADGEPRAPQPAPHSTPAQPGITVSGDARLGVVVTP